MAFRDDTMTDAAWLFPGHGSQYPGMGQALLDASPRARERIEAAERHAGRTLDDVRRHGPPDALRKSVCLEPLLVAVSMAYVDALRSRGLAPRCVAGYSAGMIAALYAAGTLTADDALRVAVRRGRVLHAAAGTGRMVAVKGLSHDAVDACVRDAGGDGHAEVAARNAPDHAAVSGTSEALSRVQRAARKRGGQTVALNVDGPWHSSLATDAADAIADTIADVPLSTPTCPVYQSTTGAPTTDPDALRRGLARQIDTPVRWNAIAERLADDAVDACLEVGPGRTLYGFLLRTWRGAGPALGYVDDGRGGSPLVRASR